MEREQVRMAVCNPVDLDLSGRNCKDSQQNHQRETSCALHSDSLREIRARWEGGISIRNVLSTYMTNQQYQHVFTACS